MSIDLIIEKVNKIEELTEAERKTVKIALKWLAAALYERIPNTPFICGEGGNKGKDGMPERYFIAPTYGVDGFAVYKKDKDYDGPGW
jgi:hypothetical protein